ncbi:hypothetical protein B0J14DRAFT_582316 [Halenospora varia]|nr:hypothetical protein B0J14DRAFT_582316 [Halenospora varia]
MSSESTPISPARFAEALKDLPISTLHLKAAELRNSIAHLDYSNEQLAPFANGTEPSLNGAPDEDCLDAIKENEVVIARMTERIGLLKAEVERRGASWMEFRSTEEVQAELARLAEDGGEGLDVDGEPVVNGTAGEVEEEERSEAWRDGTFTTGRIVNGEVRMDGAGATTTSAASSGGVNGTANGATGGAGAGGRLDDEALRRAVEERMRALAEDDDEEGMHL